MGHGTASANLLSAGKSASTADFNDADVMFAQMMIHPSVLPTA